MAAYNDPFEEFRKAREQEGFRSRQPERNVYAQRIAQLLRNLDDDASPGPETASSPMPERGELHTLIAHLFTEHSRGDERTREVVATLLGRFLEAGRRFLNRPADGEPSLEVELDYGDLFEFMLRPDPHALGSPD